jgi:hypothetical protein
VSGGRTRALLATCLATAVVAACSQTPDPVRRAGATAPPTSQESDPPSVGPADATPTPTPTPTGVPGGAQPAQVHVPVQRPGALPPEQRLDAPVVPFDGRAVYRDGVALVVREVTHGTTTATGAGAQPGQDVTSVVLDFRNGSSAPIDLTGVVVTAGYGPARTPADPVYGEGQEDFSGTVEPGAVLSAAYSFAIPSEQLDQITLTVDFDGRHAPAVWKGELR